MTDIAMLVADNIDIWSGAIQRKSGAGRGGGKRISFYGIERLRAVILDLAVRGKLMPQDEADEPADELVGRSAKALQIAIARGAFRAPAKISVSTAAPGLPKNWTATRLGALVRVINGRAYKKQELLSSGTPVLRVGNLFTSNDWYYSNLDLEDDKYITDGDLIYAWSASFGPFIWQGGRVIYHYHIWKLEPHSGADTSRDFLRLFLQNETSAIKASGHGIAMLHMTKERMEQLAINLPPLAEQRRIVAKVDELMALCDAVERESAGAMAAHQTLVEVLLATLVNSADVAGLARQWAQLESHFDTLFTTDASIAALKQTILDLAVRGKLSSGSAVNWAPKVLGSFVKDVAAGWSPKCIETPRSGTDWGVLKVSAVTWGRFQPAENKELPSSLEPRPEIEVRPGDFLISRANTADLVARSVVVPDDAPEKLMMSDKIVRFRFNPEIDPAWVNLFHASTAARAYYARVAGGTSSSMKNVSQAQIRAAQLPVPPLAEQRRIVTKVDVLMDLCDALKARLADAAKTQCHLADAIAEWAAV